MQIWMFRYDFFQSFNRTRANRCHSEIRSCGYLNRDRDLLTINRAALVYVQVIGCLVMSFWLKVCIYSHTRGVKLGLGLGFMQTSQVLPHWLNQSFSFWTLSYTQRHCHVRIEKGHVQTVAIILEAHNFLEYHYMLQH